MKKFLIILAFLLVWASCEREPLPDPNPLEPEQPYCRLIMYGKKKGEVTLRMYIDKEFFGVIYTENPFTMGIPKFYFKGLFDTTIVHPLITRESFIIIDYGRGHIIR